MKLFLDRGEIAFHRPLKLFDLSRPGFNRAQRQQRQGAVQRAKGLPGLLQPLAYILQTGKVPLALGKRNDCRLIFVRHRCGRGHRTISGQIGLVACLARRIRRAGNLPESRTVRLVSDQPIAAGQFPEWANSDQPERGLPGRLRNFRGETVNRGGASRA